MRKEYIARQKKEGRKAVAVLPVHYPKEILTAMNILAVEMWGPPGQPRGPAAGRIQTYVCAVVRNAAAFLAGGHADIMDAAFFPHTCDSIQGLATMLHDFGGWSKPCIIFLHPKGEVRASLRTFMVQELKHLTVQCTELTGKEMDFEALRWAINLHREIDGIKTNLLSNRIRLAMTDADLYRTLRRGEFLWPEDHLKELREAEKSLGDRPVQKGIPIMISGYVPEPMTIFNKLHDAGAFVVADDYAAVGRRVIPDVPIKDDLYETLAELRYAAPPCPTLWADQARRMDYLRRMYVERHAAGILIHEVKFCEPEFFDVPGLRKTFAEMGAPTLYIEGELETELSGQAVTRIEAFLEMIPANRRIA